MDLFQMRLSASLMILAIILIRVSTLHFLPKRTFLVLWAVAALRLLIPYTFSSRISILSLFPTSTGTSPSEALLTLATSSAFAQASALSSPTTAELATTLPVSVSPNDTGVSIYVWLWLIGFCILAFFFLFLYIKNKREFSTSLPLHYPTTEYWLQKHPLRRSLQIRWLDRITVPLTYGIVHPVILLPKDAPLGNEEQMQHILLHEYIHIRRFDAVWKAILAFVLCVHWFNPLVWLMYVLANRDIELSCDEAVVHALGQEEKEKYALTLIDLSAAPCSSAPLVNHFNKSVMKGRIKAIMKTKKLKLMSIFVAAALVFGVILFFATSPLTQSKTYNHPTERLEDKTIPLQWMENQQHMVQTFRLQYQSSQLMFDSLNELEASMESLEAIDSDAYQNVKKNLQVLKEDPKLLFATYNSALTDLENYANTYNTAELDFYKETILPQVVQNEIIAEEVAVETFASLEEALNAESLNLGNLPAQIKAQLEKTAEYYSFYSFSFYGKENAEAPYYTMYYFKVLRS